MDAFLQDLRYALRLIRRTPGAAIVVVLTIAVGVGANAAIFSIIRAVLLAPPPFKNSERLVELNERWPKRRSAAPISTLNYRDWVEQSTVFELTAAVSWGKRDRERRPTAGLRRRFNRFPFVLRAIRPARGYWTHVRS